MRKFRRVTAELLENDTAERGRLIASLVDFENPSDDNERLLHLQCLMLRDGSERARAALWMLVGEVAGRMIGKRHGGSLPGCAEDMKNEVAARIMARYGKRYDKPLSDGLFYWHARDSFTAAIYLAVRGVVFDFRKAESRQREIAADTAALSF